MVHTVGGVWLCVFFVGSMRVLHISCAANTFNRHCRVIGGKNMTHERS